MDINDLFDGIMKSINQFADEIAEQRLQEKMQFLLFHVFSIGPGRGLSLSLLLFFCLVHPWGCVTGLVGYSFAPGGLL